MTSFCFFSQHSPNRLPHLRRSPQKTQESQRRVALQEAQQASAEGRRWSEPQLTAGPQSSRPWMPPQRRPGSAAARGLAALGEER